MVQGGTRWYKQWYMEVHGGTRPYDNRLNRTGWYVLACTDPYYSIWVCCPAAGFAAGGGAGTARQRRQGLDGVGVGVVRGYWHGTTGGLGTEAVWVTNLQDKFLAAGRPPAPDFLRMLS